MVGLKSKRLALTNVCEKLKSLSKRSACKLLRLHQSTLFYKSKRQRSDDELREAIVKLTIKKSQIGRPMITWRLRTRLGFKDNHNRIARVYRELGMQVNRRKNGRWKTNGVSCSSRVQNRTNYGQRILCRTHLRRCHRFHIKSDGSVVVCKQRRTQFYSTRQANTKCVY